VIDEDTIFKLLKLSGVPPEKARQRSICLAEDLAWIGFESFVPHTEHSGVSDPQSGEPIPLVEYSFGKTPFSVDNAISSGDKRACAVGGSLLDRGNLRFFSIVSEIGRRLFQSAWLNDRDLRYYLRTPAHHLNALNELWWLGRFGSAVDVQARYRMHSGPEDIDWRFKLNGTDLWINLEAKNRPSDISRHVHDVEVSVRKLLTDVTKKFDTSSEDEINILGLTLFGEIDREVQQSIATWLQKQSVVDAVLIWSHEGRNRSIFDRQIKSSKAQILSMPFITEPIEERDLILKSWAVLDRKYWSEEMLNSLPPDL
jgi:hypothetical protein